MVKTIKDYSFHEYSDSGNFSRNLKTTNSKKEFTKIIIFLGVLLVNNVLATIPYIVLPFFASSQEIGEFGVAHRLISLSGTILMGLAAYYAPIFSKNHDTFDNFSHYKHSQIFSIIAYLPLFFIYVIFSDQILNLFGEGFKEAKILLIVMASGRLINSGFGLSEQFLNMNNKEKVELGNGVLTIIIFITLSFLLGNNFGVQGVTYSYSIAFAFRSLVSYIFIRKYKKSLTRTNEYY